MYGKGAYFATTADLSHPYAVRNPGAHVPDGSQTTALAASNVFTMLLCKIITGKQQLGRSSMEQPDAGYDSARNGDGSYMVIFNRDHILPIAIVEYTIQRVIP